MIGPKRKAPIWRVILIYAIWSMPIHAATDAQSIRDSEAYKATFQDFYARLDNLPVDILVDELGEQIETTLMFERGLTAPNLEYRVVQAEQQIFKTLHSALCATSETAWPTEAIELHTVDGVRIALADQDVQLEDFARIASVVARIVKNNDIDFCSLSDFRQL